MLYHMDCGLFPAGCLICSLFGPDDGNRTFLQNIDELLLNYMASHPGGSQSSLSWLWEPQIQREWINLHHSFSQNLLLHKNKIHSITFMRFHNTVKEMNTKKKLQYWHLEVCNRGKNYRKCECVFYFAKHQHLPLCNSEHTYPAAHTFPSTGKW